MFLEFAAPHSKSRALRVRLRCRAERDVSLFGAANQPDAGRRRFYLAAIGGKIVERHAASGETRLELLSDCIAVQVGKSADSGDRAGFILHDEAGQALIDDLGNGATVIGNDRGAARHRFNHDKAERLRPVDGKEQSDRAAQKVRFFVITDFADVIDERVVHQRANDFIEIVLIGPIDFCRDLERDAASYGNFDRAIDPVCTENPIRVYE
jgi:hypothetical protein